MANQLKGHVNNTHLQDKNKNQIKHVYQATSTILAYRRRHKGIDTKRIKK